MSLLGHFAGVEEGAAHFATDLAETVAFADARYNDLAELIRNSCIKRGMRPPEIPPPPPFRADPPEAVELKGLGTVIFTSGFRPDYARWVAFGEAFDDMGFPIQKDSSSTVVPGLHCMGVHF